MQEKNNNTDDFFPFDSVWHRVQEATNIRTITELSEVVGVSQPNVSKRKKEGLFPEEWAYRVGSKYNVLTEWVLTGKGPKRLEHCTNGIFKELEEWVLQMSGSGNNEWFVNQVEVAFPLFKEWKKRKIESESDSTDT